MRFDNTTNEVDTIETLIIFLPANQNHHFMQRYEQLGEVELLKERWLSACCHVHFQPLCLLLLLADSCGMTPGSQVGAVNSNLSGSDLLSCMGGVHYLR